MSDKIDQIVWRARELSDRVTAARASGVSMEGLLVDGLSELMEAVEAAAIRPGEVLFCARSSDRCMPATVNYWLIMAERDHASSETIERVRRLHQQALNWQNDLANASFIKVPT